MKNIRECMYSTMRIESDWGEGGTGFLVARRTYSTHHKLFLVTNKHVLNTKRDLRLAATDITLHVNRQRADGSIFDVPVQYPLVAPDGSRRWREHPDQDVDVLAIDVTPIAQRRPAHPGDALLLRYIEYKGFADPKARKRFSIDVGDEVLVIGYPQGVRHHANSLPLVRQGMIASMLGEALEDELPDRGSRRRILRGFLFDGIAIPGSSGSPVFSRPAAIRIVLGGIPAVSAQPILLLGIVAETRYARIQTNTRDTIGFAGLGLAFDAETVKETIELFFYEQVT